MAYIYLHRRNDTGEVFYVGKGTGKRAYQKTDRNQHWHNVVNKAGFTAEIIVKGLTDAEAYWAEPLLIEAHGGVGNLTNISTGGEGWSSEEVKALWQDPAYREKQSKAVSKALKEVYKDPAYREKLSKAATEQWQDPAFREKHSKAMKDPAERERKSKASKEMWQDPAYREKISKTVKEAMQDLTVLEKISKASKERWQDPTFREKMSKAVKEQNKRMWQDPAHREKISTANKRKVECDKCGRMIGITVLPQHQRGSRCYKPVTKT